METKNTNEVSLQLRPIEIPQIQDFLKAGVQFGHQVNKWDPKMRDFIFTKRDKIHVIDLSKTVPLLQEALNFIMKASSQGEILFVGTKRQAREIIKELAVKCGAHYIINRWPGGLLTNFKLIQQSIKHFNELEHEFEEGIVDRTKFEVSQMKKDWMKTNRIYEGIKQMKNYPKAIIIVDSKYEKGAVVEAKKVKIPIVAMVDTNADPTKVDYAVPSNDDAIKSIRIICDLFAQAVIKGNKGKGVKHNFKDYSKFEVKILKLETEKKEDFEEVSSLPSDQKENPVEKILKLKTKTTSKSKVSKGILEKIQQDAESAKIKRAVKSRKSKVTNSK